MKNILSALALMALPFLATAQGAPQQPMQQQQAPPTDFSEEELDKFSRVVKEMETIQAAAEEKMMAAIEAEGLDVDTYNEMAMAQQNPNASSDNISEDDKAKFTKLNGEMQKIQTEMQPQMVSAIEEEGMEVQEYQQMFMAYQQSPDLQKKVQDRIGE